MSVRGYSVRENWRVVLLVIFVLVSTIALFPLGGGADTGNATANVSDDPTNLQYGLELSGGTRVRAPLVGLTAEDVSVQDPGAAEREIAAAMGLSPVDVEVRAGAQGQAQGQGQGQGQATATVEVFNPNVTEEEFAAGLQEAGFDVSADDIRDGVTDQTREDAVTTLNDRINQGGLTGGTAFVSNAIGTGEGAFVVVEVPNADREEVVDLIGERGQVRTVALFPENGSYRRVPLFDQQGLASISPIRQDENNQPVVPVTLTDPAAENFSNAMVRFGFTDPQGIGSCRFQTTPENPGYCLLTVVDGEVVFSASMGQSLAQTIQSGNFERDPRYQTSAPTQSEAQRLRLNLVAGALPTTLDIDSGTTFFLQPSQAGEFKQFSLVTGLAAVLAVTLMVFGRYRRAEVAIPMLVTAAAEVYILLGFASAVGLALDLSHIAGFIAVIGTGVDDLIIIADEILQRGEIKTGRVFRSRFRKAFWVIGAAAATTIIAMSPLAVLSLGDLQGFAIITIVGVLIGVLVTRPAYGDVLRNLILD
jgi:preprotein translocase subunit SecD